MKAEFYFQMFKINGKGERESEKNKRKFFIYQLFQIATTGGTTEELVRQPQLKSLFYCIYLSNKSNDFSEKLCNWVYRSCYDRLSIF